MSRVPSILVAGVVLAAVAAVLRKVAARARRGGDTPGGDTPGGRAQGGWATCSAPSALAYDRTFGWLLGGLYRRMADDLAATVAGIAAPEVLEIGPGPGGLAIELARRVPGLRLTGIDVDPAMVERARARARREGLEDRLAFAVGDVAALSFADASFDLVTSSFSVHHWPDAARGFTEVRRVLRPGGRAIVYDVPDRWGRLETKAPPLAAAAAAGGFRDATPALFRWPGPIAFVVRLEVSRIDGASRAPVEAAGVPGD